MQKHIFISLNFFKIILIKTILKYNSQASHNNNPSNIKKPIIQVTSTLVALASTIKGTSFWQHLKKLTQKARSKTHIPFCLKINGISSDVKEHCKWNCKSRNLGGCWEAQVFYYRQQRTPSSSAICKTFCEKNTPQEATGNSHIFKNNATVAGPAPDKKNYDFFLSDYPPYRKTDIEPVLDPKNPNSDLAHSSASFSAKSLYKTYKIFNNNQLLDLFR